MKFVIPTLKARDLFFLLSFLIFLSLSFLSSTLLYQFVPEIFTKLGMILVLVLAIIRELMVGRYSINQLISIGVIGTMSLSVMIATNFLNVLAIFIALIFFFRDVPFVKIARISFYVSLFLLVLTIVCSQIGIIQNFIEAPIGGRYREYLGFRYSLFAPAVLLNIVSLWTYLNKEKCKWISLVMWLAGTIWMYQKTDSRLTFISTLIILFMYLVCSNFPSVIDNMRKFLMPFSLTYVVSAILSILVVNSFKYPTDFLYRLNLMLGGRIGYASRSLEMYGYKLLGQEITWVGNGLDIRGNASNSTYLYVDNLYIQILQRYGILFLIFFISTTVGMIVKLLRRNEIFLAMIVISLGFHGLIDDLILYPQFNTFWFLFAILISKFYTIQD